MRKFFLMFLIAALLVGCGTSTKSTKRGLMLMELEDMPRNAKFTSPKYQQRLKKSQKHYQKSRKKSYKRARR